jgi:tetratricopeptide (TPR) repeat protein
MGRAISAGADAAPEREAAVDRLLRYYAHTAQKASVPIARSPRPVPDGPAPAHTPALPGPESARTWLRTEQPSLETAFTHARSHGLDGHAISLAAGLAEILLTDGPWTRAPEIYDALGNRGNKAWALNYYAATLAASGQRSRGLALYQQALAMNRELNKPDDEAVSLEGIAEHHLAAGDPAAGAAYLHQALELYQRLGMASDTHRVHNRLAGLTTR